jgi:hypothetical protein
MTTTMYFVAAQSDDTGYNLDLFVEASSTDEARALWKAYYLTGWDETALDEMSLTLWPVPALTGKPQAIRWYGDMRPITIINPQYTEA